MSLTLEIILQARFDSVLPNNIEVDLPQDVLDLAAAEAKRLHVRADVLIIALLQVCDGLPLDPHMRDILEQDFIDSIGLPDKAARIVKQEASKRKANPAEVISALLVMWQSQSDAIKDALAEQMKQHKDATEGHPKGDADKAS